MRVHGYNKLAEWVEYELKIADYKNAPEKIKKFSDIILKRYNLKKLNFTSTKQIEPYVDEMFDLLGETYESLQTFVPIQDYQIKYYKDKYLKYINPGFIKYLLKLFFEHLFISITGFVHSFRLDQ